jgi:hypothetical protein
MTLAMLLLGAALAQAPASAAERPALDYPFFKERVQPIFLKKRAGHARCVACHAHRSPVLQPLAKGATGWNDEQSKKNFDMWKLFVTPGQPLKSQMLRHPLATKAGGDKFHAGGKHWTSQDDPEFKTLVEWVNGAKLGGAK